MSLRWVLFTVSTFGGSTVWLASTAPPAEWMKKHMSLSRPLSAMAMTWPWPRMP